MAQRSWQIKMGFLLILTVCMLPAVSFANEKHPFVIDREGGELLLSDKQLSWYYDSSGTISFRQLKAISWGKASGIRAGKEGALWTNFLLENRSDRDQQYILQTGKWGRVEAFVVDGDTTNHFQSGSLLPLKNRSQPSNINAIKLLLAANGKLEIFMKFSSVYSIYEHEKIDIAIAPLSQFEKAESSRMLWQGIFFGIILVMALYNLFILFAVKDISYLYYVLSIIGIGLYFAFYYGFGIEYLWPNSPIGDSFSFILINPFTGWARLLFTRTYLHTPALLPKINRLISLLALACIAIFATGLFCYFLRIDILKPMVIIIGLLGAGVLVMMLTAGIVAYFVNGYQPAKYFIAANILMVIGAIAFILRETGWMEDTFISRYLVQVGVVVQAVVLSLGLASRLNKMRLQLAHETLDKERLALEKEIEKKELIEEQRQQLQVQVKEKTADLQLKNTMLEQTIEQVKKSEDQLSQLNQVKDKLFSIISHDLRNPLATMQSFLKLITEHQEKLSNEEKKKLFEEAQQSLNNLNELLYNLLQWSRSQMNLLEFNPTRFQLKPIIDNAIRAVQLNAHMKQVTIHADITDTIWTFADKHMVEFIIRNLLSNAIKFSHRNSEVHIRAYIDKGQVYLEVCDSGIGISESKIKKLLEKNTTLTRRGTEKEKGTGLGLLISKEFIEKNGGSLTIHSIPGKESTLGFSIPAGG